MENENNKDLMDFDYELSWANSDIEKILGFGVFGAKSYTNVNAIISFLLGWVFFAGVYYLLKFLLTLDLELVKIVNDRLLSGGLISYTTLYFFLWGMAILFIKRFKLSLQKKALALAVVPQDPNYHITQETAVGILKRLNVIVDSSKNFIVLNRIDAAISNLNNIGNIGDVATILSTQERKDEENVSASFMLLNTIMWIIPILGFIGTVLGLGLSISNFGGAVQGAGDISVIKDSISSITGGLGTAFDTTLVSLVLVVILQFLSSIAQSKELAFLNECSVYCQDNVISKLRIIK